jgi:uncharacterized protein YcbK (DUF882 family)
MSSEDSKKKADVSLKASGGADAKIKEMTNLIVEGKVSINDLMKTIVDSIVYKPRKQYTRVKPIHKKTKEEQKAYQKAYYQQYKAKRLEEYQKDKEIINENQKKYYRLRKIQELQKNMEGEQVKEK